ncbi:MAG: DUF4114 domain-containing protein [Pseudomonadota bacterium]
MKYLLRPFAYACLLLTFGQAHAVPSLFDVTGIAGTDLYFDGGRASVQPIAVSGFTTYSSHAGATLMFENAGYADTTSFGIYGYSEQGGSIQVGKTQELFSGPASANAGASLNHVTVGERFGFYIHVGATERTYYSHPSLNGDGTDHALLFDTSDFTDGVVSLAASDIVIAWEDLWGGGDEDFNDMVVGLRGVATVSEPYSLSLLSLGILGLGFRKLRYPTA